MLTRANAAIKINTPPDTDLYCMGMPVVIPPSKDADKWLMWFQCRSKSLSSDIVKGSTGRYASPASF